LRKLLAAFIGLGFLLLPVSPVSAETNVSRDIFLFLSDSDARVFKECTSYYKSDKEDGYSRLRLNVQESIQAPFRGMQMSVSFFQSCSSEPDKYIRSVEILGPTGVALTLEPTPSLSQSVNLRDDPYWDYPDSCGIFVRSCWFSEETYFLDFGHSAPSGQYSLRLQTTFVGDGCSFDFETNTRTCVPGETFTKTFTVPNIVNITQSGVPAAWESSTYVPTLEAMQFDDGGSLCWIDVFDQSLIGPFGVTGFRWKVERNKSGKWDQWEFDIPLPEPDAPTYLIEDNAYGLYGNVKTVSRQAVTFQPNAVKAGETIRCSVAAMIGEAQNEFRTSEFTATLDGPDRIPPEPKLIAKQRTLASFSETSTTLTTKQKSQVKAAVEANPNATKFICTGIRYVSQPMSENIKVRKRAKAACDYAKTLNPQLSTWYQNKPTEARSYAGKVLLTIKSPAN
jgi:hypothetical protein